ncbi:MAG: hypothetical protein NTZ10_01765 [Candidatus Saganbacteria bacterium]|nr:hypothetical protein [Candidatus Saganbacteria bacterium]
MSIYAFQAGSKRIDIGGRLAMDVLPAAHLKRFLANGILPRTRLYGDLRTVDLRNPNMPVEVEEAARLQKFLGKEAYAKMAAREPIQLAVRTSVNTPKYAMNEYPYKYISLAFSLFGSPGEGRAYNMVITPYAGLSHPVMEFNWADIFSHGTDCLPYFNLTRLEIIKNPDTNSTSKFLVRRMQLVDRHDQGLAAVFFKNTPLSAWTGLVDPPGTKGKDNRYMGMYFLGNLACALDRIEKMFPVHQALDRDLRKKEEA